MEQEFIARGVQRIESIDCLKESAPELYAYLRDNDYSKVVDLEEDGHFDVQRFCSATGRITSFYLEIDARHGRICDLNLTVGIFNNLIFEKKRCYWRCVSLFGSSNMQITISDGQGNFNKTETEKDISCDEEGTDNFK